MNTFRLSIHVPIVLTPVLLNLTLDLGFHLYHRDNLGTGLHQFGLGQHTLVAQKVLKACVDQHQVITGAGAATSLWDVAMLTAIYGVSLPSTLAMPWWGHLRLRVILVTLLGQDHPTVLVMRDVNLDLMERETKL